MHQVHPTHHPTQFPSSKFYFPFHTKEENERRGGRGGEMRWDDAPCPICQPDLHTRARQTRVHLESMADTLRLPRRQLTRRRRSISRSRRRDLPRERPRHRSQPTSSNSNPRARSRGGRRKGGGHGRPEAVACT